MLQRGATSGITERLGSHTVFPLHPPVRESLVQALVGPAITCTVRPSLWLVGRQLCSYLQLKRTAHTELGHIGSGVRYAWVQVQVPAVTSHMMSGE